MGAFRVLVVVLACLFGSSAMAGVTEIVHVQNNTDSDLEILCFENAHLPNHNATLRKGDSASAPRWHAWIPWATNSADMNSKKYIRVRFSKTEKDGSLTPVEAYIWQYEGSVRMTRTPAWAADAPAIPGFQHENGTRKLSVSRDGSIYIEQYKAP